MSTAATAVERSKSRTQHLADALHCEVIEDVGYRGILYNDEQGFLRYHISVGLQKVVRVGETWRSTETVLTPEDVLKFLDEAGVRKPKNPINTQALQKLGGEVIEKFVAGGGIMHNRVYLRYSPILGIDIVEKALSKWVSKKKIFLQSDLAVTVRDHGWGVVQNAIREAIVIYEGAQRAEEKKS